MNDLQLKIFTVIKAIIQIDDFDEYYKDHTIRYGVMNYVAKYSLANNKYLITQRCLDHLKQKRFLNNKGLRRGLKSKKSVLLIKAALSKVFTESLKAFSRFSSPYTS